MGPEEPGQDREMDVAAGESKGPFLPLGPTHRGSLPWDRNPESERGHLAREVGSCEEWPRARLCLLGSVPQPGRVAGNRCLLTLLGDLQVTTPTQRSACRGSRGLSGHCWDRAGASQPHAPRSVYCPLYFAGTRPPDPEESACLLGHSGRLGTRPSWSPGRSAGPGRQASCSCADAHGGQERGPEAWREAQRPGERPGGKSRLPQHYVTAVGGKSGLLNMAMVLAC